MQHLSTAGALQINHGLGVGQNVLSLVCTITNHLKRSTIASSSLFDIPFKLPASRLYSANSQVPTYWPCCEVERDGLAQCSCSSVQLLEFGKQFHSTRDLSTLLWYCGRDSPRLSWPAGLSRCDSPAAADAVALCPAMRHASVFDPSICYGHRRLLSVNIRRL